MSLTYQRTHPWLKFYARELERPLPDLWAMLGECQSKCEHIAGTPLEPAVANRLHLLYLAKGVVGTTAIEGNTLTEKDVLAFLEGKLALPPSREYLAQEVENIIDGCQLVFARIMDGHPLPLDAETFRMLNRIVLSRLTVADDVIPGEIRKHSVGVFRYRGAPAEDCPYLLERLGEWLSGKEFDCPAELRIATAIIKAVLAHLYLAWIHPFGDGNGRTARLVEFQILLLAGVPTPAAHLLSNHYNQTRTEYYRQLDYASRSGGEIVPFLRYAVRGLLDGLKAQLLEIRQYQLDVMWRYHVHERFKDRKSPSDKRRRDLVLALSSHESPVPLSKLPAIDHQMAVAYHDRTRMTLIRDLNALIAMDLVLKQREGYLANKAIIEAFLPDRPDINKLAVARQR